MALPVLNTECHGRQFALLPKPFIARHLSACSREWQFVEGVLRFAGGRRRCHQTNRIALVPCLWSYLTTKRIFYHPRRAPLRAA